MYHSIYIGDKNTWDDFHLIPNSRPVVAEPDPRTMYINVYGNDGDLDATESRTGDVQYKNREGSWDFTVANDYENWEVLHHKIANYLHGKKFKIILEDDPNYYYIGRITFSEWNSDKNWSKVTLDYHLEPFKYELTSSLEDWLWDPFSFETGIIREYGSITVSGSYTLKIPGGRRPNVPSFTVNSSDGQGMTLTYKDRTYTLSDGTQRIRQIVIGEEEETLVINGNGTISVSYQGGWL